MYQLDREWGDSYVSQVTRILMRLLPHLVELSTAPIEMDIKCATDFVVRLKGGNIAVRLRRPDCQFRDLTIRALRDSGNKTELEKIKEGHGFRYFYGWIDKNNIIAEWMLIDLDKVRDMGLLDIERPLIPNFDGTYFVGIPLADLDEADCLLDYVLREPTFRQLRKSRQVNLQISPIEGLKRAEQGYTAKGQPRDENLRKQLEDIERFRHMQGLGEDE